MKKQSTPLSSFTAAEESSGFLLWQLTALWQRSLNALLKKLDLTHAQFVVLMSAHWLGAQNASVTQVELARHAKMEVMLVSNILKVLEEKKLIIRAVSSSDSRAKSIKVTAEGARVLRPAVKEVEAFDAAFFAPLGKDTARFNAYLLKIITANYES